MNETTEFPAWVESPRRANCMEAVIVTNSARLYFNRAARAALAILLTTLPSAMGGEKEKVHTVKKSSDLVEVQETTPVLPLPTKRANPLLPPMELILKNSSGSAAPNRTCSAHVAGGNILVTQPNPTTVVFTMTGLAVAKSAGVVLKPKATYNFQFSQCFDVVIHDPIVKTPKLSLEGKVLGRLRSNCECPRLCTKHAAKACITTPGIATIAANGTELATVTLPAHSIGCCQNETVYDHDGPYYVPVSAGSYDLSQNFGFTAHAPCGFFVYSSSADFTPDIVLDARALGHVEPFVGIANKDFGFTVTVKLLPE